MSTASASEPTCPSRQRHWEMLVISCLVIVASLALRVEDGSQVKLAEFALPPLCLSRSWFGVSCPGCGLTRSFVQLAHGHWLAAWEAHRLGWLLAVMVVLQVPYRIHGLCQRDSALLSVKVRSGIAYLLIGLLIANWLVGMIWFPTSPN